MKTQISCWEKSASPFRSRGLNCTCVVLITLLQSVATHATYAQGAKPSAAQSTQITPPVSGYTLPFTSLPGHGGVVVRLRVNDKTDANFLVDTGTDAIVVRSNLVNTLKLKTRKAPYATGTALPAGTPTEMVTLDLLSGGGLNASHADAFVSDAFASLGGIKSIEAVDGILGTQFLQLFAVLIDFEKNQLLLIPKGNLNEIQRNYLGVVRAQSAGVALAKYTDDLRLTAPAQIDVNGHTAELSFLIDTGFPKTVAFDPKNAMRLENQGGVPQMMLSSTGPLTYYVFPVSSFGIGNKEAAAKETKLAPFECAVITDKQHSVSLLGLDYLSHFRVLLDYPAQKMYLAPVYNPKKLPFPTVSSRQSAQKQIADAIIAPTTDGRWTVVSTQKDQYFGKAGVQAGDIIQMINGKSLDGLQLFGITSLMRPSEYDTDDLLLLRDGKPVTVTLHRK